MARALATEIDRLILSGRREPAFRLEVYDLRSTASHSTPTRVNDVVRWLQGIGSLPTIVGPRDFTGDVVRVEVEERAGDYVESGIASSSIGVSIVDPHGILDPVSGSEGRWLRQGNVVVLREGDAQVDEADWPITFTGRIVGQPGQNRNRTTGKSELVFAAVGREEMFLRRQCTSRNFLQGTLYSEIVEDIATTDMGLTLDELDLPAVYGQTVTAHASTQFVRESPLVSVAKVLFADGQLPRFQGDGRLGLIDTLLTKAPARVYTAAEDPVIEIVRPIVERNGANVVVVLGLDANMTKVRQPRQAIAQASATVGFFSPSVSIPVYWSEDHTLQAEDTQMRVIRSVNDGPFNVGGEKYIETTGLDGSLGGVIEIESGLNLALVAVLGGAWIASHKIPDYSPPTGGSTIPVGRLVEGAIGKVLFSIIGTMGRGQYEITGIPFEYVFQELRGEARVADLDDEERQEIEVENHMLTSQAMVDAVAMRVLRRLRAKQNRRAVRMIHDPRLEPDDLFETPSGTRLMIESIQRTLQHGGQHEASLEGFEVTPGVRP